MRSAEQLPGQLWGWFISVVVFIEDAVPGHFRCCTQQWLTSRNCFLTDFSLWPSNLLLNPVKQVFLPLSALTSCSSLLTTANRSLIILPHVGSCLDASCWLEAAVAGRSTIKRQLVMTNVSAAEPGEWKNSSFSKDTTLKEQPFLPNHELFDQAIC